MLRTRTACLGLLLCCCGAVAACDSSVIPPPPVCESAPLIERADTVFVAVGDSVALDLAVMFAGVADVPLSFSLADVPPGVRLQDNLAVVAPETEGVRVFEVSAASACGVVAEGDVTVSALPPGSSCPAPIATPATSIRVPTGGVRLVRHLWGADGLVSGLFHRDSPAEVHGGDGLVQAFTTWAAGSPSLQIIPGAEAGHSSLTINATDACLRPVAVDVPIEVVYAPHCVLIEAGYADFFPLDVGRMWTYRYERGGSPGTGGGTNWSETGDETWEVTGTTRCNEGDREYTLLATRVPDGGTPVVTARVLGSSNGVIVPREGLDQRWPSIQRFNPPEPELLTICGGCGGIQRMEIAMQREVGIVATDALYGGSGHSFEYYRRTLVTH